MSAISITESFVDQFTAAAYLSEVLKKLGCPHAYIGGFAWALLGSDRRTQINILIDTKNLDMLALRERLCQTSRQIASVGLRLYFVKEAKDSLVGDALVRASKDNVLIETLQVGSLGLPTSVGMKYTVQHQTGVKIDILHPGVMILTKMKRWYHNRESTRPKTMAKNSADKRDLDFLVSWLTDHNLTVEPDLYEGKDKGELLTFIRGYREALEGSILLEQLRKAMKPRDWDLL